jgi:hypothetical protein
MRTRSGTSHFSGGLQQAGLTSLRGKALPG